MSTNQHTPADSDASASPAQLLEDGLAGADTSWSLSLVCAWLLTEGRLTDTPQVLIENLGHKLVDAGFPVMRIRIGLRTLHPEHFAFSFSWTPEGGVRDHGRVSYGIEQRDSYRGSPLEELNRTGRPVRRRLDDLVEGRDHGVLHEIAAAGGTDYIALPLRFSTTTGAHEANQEEHADIGGHFVFVTDADAGFDDADLAKCALVAEFVAPIAEVLSTRSIASALLNTYVGPRTGERVLQGRIRRGDADLISAAIWFSDLRDFTELTETLDSNALLSALNAYFELVHAAVTARGGEVLRFIGDAMLIVFPIDHNSDTATACEAALDAANDAFASLAALNHRRARRGQRVIRFGVGLHVGEVVYGNVGAPDRLDFTVMGPAVNRTARLESLTKTVLPAHVERPMLLSAAFGTHVARPMQSLGKHAMKGVAEPFEVFALTDAE